MRISPHRDVPWKRVSGKLPPRAGMMRQVTENETFQARLLQLHRNYVGGVERAKGM